jgi:hypothetical protein
MAFTYYITSSGDGVSSIRGFAGVLNKRQVN